MARGVQHHARQHVKPAWLFLFVRVAQSLFYGDSLCHKHNEYDGPMVYDNAIAIPSNWVADFQVFMLLTHINT